MPQHNKNRQYDILAVFCYLFVASHKNFQSFHIKRQHRGAFLLQCPGKQLCVRGKHARFNAACRGAYVFVSRNALYRRRGVFASRFVSY